MRHALIVLVLLPLAAAAATPSPGASELDQARYQWLYSRFRGGEEAYCPLTKAVRCRPLRDYPDRYWCDYRELSTHPSVTWAAKRTQITGSGTNWRWIAGDTPKDCQINIRADLPGG